jgi:hypothetical protein
MSCLHLVLCSVIICAMMVAIARKEQICVVTYL